MTPNQQQKMAYNFNPDSKRKGLEFETYVETILFPKDKYELLHKTSDQDQNEERYVKSSLKPDFKFKCLTTNYEFYVEAKYRSKSYKNQYEVLSEQQERSFPALFEECPIFVAFGYGGESSRPEFVSLIPFNKITDRYLSPEIIKIFNIENRAYPCSLFEATGLFSDAEQKDEEQKEELVLKANNKEPLVKSNLVKYLVPTAIIATVLLMSFVIYNTTASSTGTSTSIKPKLTNILSTYYSSSDLSQIERLPKFLSTKNINWYGTKGLDPERIIKLASDYNKEYPYRVSQIDWSSLRVVEDEDGYYASYSMLYKSKKTDKEDYKVYDLKLITFWDKDLRLKSITESQM